ncbi:MAG TPA: hypothetical protein VF006_24760 [Longimicrobium sp.]
MDPIIGTGLIFIFGAAALLSGLCALVVLVVDGRISRIAVGVGAASTAVLFACSMAMPPGYSRAEQDRIDRLHAQFAPALERYRQTHGDYPPTLEAAGIAIPATEYGPLRYHVHRSKEGTSFYEVSFGDYYDNGFTASFNSERKTWYLDQ